MPENHNPSPIEANNNFAKDQGIQSVNRPAVQTRLKYQTPHRENITKLISSFTHKKLRQQSRSTYGH
jgi:hypothetical protein